jgi:hypothetical protein
MYNDSHHTKKNHCKPIHKSSQKMHLNLGQILLTFSRDQTPNVWKNCTVGKRVFMWVLVKNSWKLAFSKNNDSQEHQLSTFYTPKSNPRLQKSTVQLYPQVWKPPPTPHPRLFWLHSNMNRIEQCPSHAVPLDLNCLMSKDSFQSDSETHVSNLYGGTAKISWQWSWDWILGRMHTKI